MQEAESVLAAAVVDTDGMIVGGAPEGSEELENLAASAAGMLSFLKALGGDADLGEASQATVEYTNGTLFIGPLDEQDFLLILAETGAPLGQVRLILRRYRPELQQHLNL